MHDKVPPTISQMRLLSNVSERGHVQTEFPRLPRRTFTFARAWKEPALGDQAKAIKQTGRAGKGDQPGGGRMARGFNQVGSTRSVGGNHTAMSIVLQCMIVSRQKWRKMRKK